MYSKIMVNVNAMSCGAAANSRLLGNRSPGATATGRAGQYPMSLKFFIKY